MGDDDCLCDHAQYDRRDECPERLYDQGFQFQGENVVPEHGVAATFERFTQFHEDMRDWETHVQLQNDLVEYMWTHVGNQ